MRRSGSWRQRRLAIEADVRSAGVPDEHVAEEAAALSGLFAEVRASLAQPGLGLYETQRLLSDLTAAKLDLPRPAGRAAEPVPGRARNRSPCTCVGRTWPGRHELRTYPSWSRF